MQNLHFYWDLKMHNSALRLELRVGIHEEIILCTHAEIFSSHSLTYWTNNFSLLYAHWAKYGFKFFEEVTCEYSKVQKCTYCAQKEKYILTISICTATFIQLLILKSKFIFGPLAYVNCQN